MGDDEVSVQTAARRLNVAERTIHRMVERGDLEGRYEPHGRARRLYVTKASIAAWLERQQRETE